MDNSEDVRGKEKPNPKVIKKKIGMGIGIGAITGLVTGIVFVIIMGYLFISLLSLLCFVSAGFLGGLLFGLKKGVKEYLTQPSHVTPITLQQFDDAVPGGIGKGANWGGITLPSSGEIDEEREIFIPQSVLQLNDDIFHYLRDNLDKREISLTEIASTFGIKEGDVIWHLKELMREKNLGGEIDKLKGVYIPQRKKIETSPQTQEQSGRMKTQEPETPPQPQPKEETPQYRSARKVRDKISKLKDKEEMVDTREVEKAVKEGNIERAGSLLEELEDKYQEYKHTIERLKELDRRKSDLAEKLAKDEIDRDTFNEAVEGIKAKKHDLETKLEELRKEVIYEDYEKPF